MSLELESESGWVKCLTRKKTIENRYKTGEVILERKRKKKFKVKPNLKRKRVLKERETNIENDVNWEKKTLTPNQGGWVCGLIGQL